MRYITAALLLLAVLALMTTAQGCGDSEEDSASSETSPSAAAGPDDKTATYTVTFDASWSQQTHPQDFPPDPHFSGLIGATHNEHVTFWQEGLDASPGIQNMAETGSKDPLNQEIDTAISKGTAYGKLSGEGINPSPGSVSLTFDVDEDYPSVTLVSMIAPSPDWFVGVDTLSLLEDGQWVDTKVVELMPYDAGTDSGLTYGAPDEETQPHKHISIISAGVLANNGTVAPMGTFTFTRIS